ncbi:exopolyphosphatase [Brevibacillus agri]|uniref:Exopolyphosphatase n=1 Tax=Brevibacillus agri TaxID=51101 RepID=A0A3M8BDB3_9BACL|nr:MULTISPECIES: hypothetical protein [Brevibacillus]ELK39304.1 exopolyphosphatase [Brevibacillus agri BAB-2500]EJL44207.1 hypothetical protein PMI08_02007 [Brevibacillus sp. CF112]MED1643253.1 exopolyphosphatase [Brevibacillus agri]MED1656455.1 exopolyphosphatase [Brevibacillus agri]MED1685350.1 exopolyphosphatase [Brevibacillus agri]
MKKSIGVIDLGSNTARLVIYEQDDSGMVTEVDNIKYSLRLSNHLHAGRLDEEGIAKTLTATLMADGTYVRVQPRSPSPFNSQLFFGRKPFSPANLPTRCSSASSRLPPCWKQPLRFNRRLSLSGVFYW